MFVTTREKRALLACLSAMDDTIHAMADHIELIDRQIAAIKGAGILNSQTLQVQQHQINALRDHVKPTIPA